MMGLLFSGMVCYNQLYSKTLPLWLFFMICKESSSYDALPQKSYPAERALQNGSTELDGLVCHKFDKQSDFIKCKKGYSCFSAAYVSFKNGSLHDVKHDQGCWSPEMAKKRSDDCSTGVCKFQSLEELLNPKKKLSNILLFCCCNGSFCNNVTQPFSGKIPKKSSTLPSTDAVGNKSSNMWLMVIILFSSVMSLCLFVCVMLLYCWKWRKKNQHKICEKSNVYYDGYSTDTENIDLSEQSLDNILHGNLIHQGHHNAIRLGCFQDKTVAVKVFPPRNRKQWCNEKKIYKMLGSHQNIAEDKITQPFPHYEFNDNYY